MPSIRAIDGLKKKSWIRGASAKGGGREAATWNAATLRRDADLIPRGWCRAVVPALLRKSEKPLVDSAAD